jgi:integrase
MARIDLNAKKLAALKPGKDRVDYFDTNLPCFFVRVTPTGVKSFGALYWHAGRKRRYTIGNYPPLTLADARDKAKEVLRAAELGKDPAGEKKLERAAETFKEVADEFLEKYARAPRKMKDNKPVLDSHGQPMPKKKSWKEDERRINNVLVPRFGNIRAKEIRRGDVRAFLEDLAARAPIEANRTLALMRKIFNWALSRELVETSPCLQLQRPGLEQKRKRKLDDEELRTVWKACEADDSFTGKILQLRIITGQRGKELARMRWADIEDRWWTQPEDQTKNEMEHRVWFSDPAWKIIRALPRTSEWVFPNRRKKGEPIEWTGKALARIQTAAGELLRPHGQKESQPLDFQARDLRRTVATRMSEAGVDTRTVSKILNHKEGGVTQIYNRNQFDKEKQQAWTLWAKKLAIILSGLRAMKK